MEGPGDLRVDLCFISCMSRLFVSGVFSGNKMGIRWAAFTSKSPSQNKICTKGVKLGSHFIIYIEQKLTRLSVKFFGYFKSFYFL